MDQPVILYKVFIPIKEILPHAVRWKWYIHLLIIIWKIQHNDKALQLLVFCGAPAVEDGNIPGLFDTVALIVESRYPLIIISGIKVVWP